MSFSRLLLVAASSKKYIEGEKGSKIFIKPERETLLSGRDAYEGEVILCFQLDEKREGRGKYISSSLGIINDDKRCDGLIFYAKDETQERVICLVEMKHKNIDEAARQINIAAGSIKMAVYHRTTVLSWSRTRVIPADAGTIYNIVPNVSTTIAVDIQQTQGHLQGTVVLGLKIQGGGAFIGTIDTLKHFQLLIVNTAGQAIMLLQGSLQSASSLSGEYYS